MTTFHIHAYADYNFKWLGRYFEQDVAYTVMSNIKSHYPPSTRLIGTAEEEDGSGFTFYTVDGTQGNPSNFDEVCQKILKFLGLEQ